MDVYYKFADEDDLNLFVDSLDNSADYEAEDAEIESYVLEGLVWDHGVVGTLGSGPGVEGEPIDW